MQSKEKDPRIQALPISELKFKKNVRSEAEKSDIESLARSIKEVGVLQPIHVRTIEGGFEILFGHRRTLAAIACGQATIPAIIVDAIDTDSAVLQRQLVENIQRENLNPIDQALAIEELMELDQLTNGEVAERIGTIPAAISKSLAILSLQPVIQAWVRDGLIPASCAYELSKVKEEGPQLALAQKVKEGKLTRAQLQAAIKPAPFPLSSEKPRSISRVTAQLGNGQTVTVASASLDISGFINCLEELLTRARKERGRGMELVTFIKLLRDQAKTNKKQDA